MRFLVARYPEHIETYLKNHNCSVLTESFNIHPIYLEDSVKKFLEANKDSDAVVITYNTAALDYVPIELISFINSEGSEESFKETFSDQLCYMFAGEIILNMENLMEES